MDNFIDYYITLGIPYDATKDEIQEAYQKKKKEDPNEDIEKAYDILSDENSKELFDSILAYNLNREETYKDDDDLKMVHDVEISHEVHGSHHDAVIHEVQQESHGGHHDVGMIQEVQQDSHGGHGGHNVGTRQEVQQDSHGGHGGHGGHEGHGGGDEPLMEIVKRINEKNKNKEHTIRVLIIEDDNKYSDNYTNNDDFVGGYHHDVFKMLLQDVDGGLYQNYKYELFFSDKNLLNYDGFVNDVHDNKYDIVIGGFSINKYRESKINFSIPLYINRIGILHLRKKKFFDNLKILLYELCIIFAVITILAIVLSFLKYYFFPNMYVTVSKEKSDNKSKMKKKSEKEQENLQSDKYKDHLRSSISFMFGEAGPVAENTPATYSRIAFILFCFVVGFIVLFYAQARITTISLILETTDAKIEFDEINSEKYRPFLAKEGNAESYKIQLLRGKNERVEIENSSNDNIVNKYFFEKDNYDGVVMLYTDAYQYLQDKKYDFAFSSEGYGLEPSCWIVSQRPHCIPIIKDINLLILKHRSLGTNSMSDTIEFGHLTMICKDYIKEKNACLF